jgi:vanillate O-demethylase monooxygenase subunit
VIVMFIENAWYIAAWANEVNDEPVARTICDHPVVLFRDAVGSPVALRDRCPHRGLPLSLGTVGDRGLQCGYHGLVFDGAGRCVHIPNQVRIPRKAAVTSYPLVEKDEFLWIWVGDPDRADPSTVIDYPYHNDYEQWPHKHEVLHLGCDYRLLADNLMDLTHVAYVHQATFGGNPLDEPEAKIDMSVGERGLTFCRWLLDSTPPPTYTQVVPFAGRVDRWQQFEYVAPGTMMQWSGALDVGRGAYDNREQDGGFNLRLFHGVTPETATSCHYFWSTANGFRQHEPEITEAIFKAAAVTFDEDRVVLEAQQAMLARSGEDGLVDVGSDSVRLKMRQIMENMLDAERREASVVGGG